MFEKHYESEDVVLLFGQNVALKSLEKTTYTDFPVSGGQRLELTFDRAYVIEHINWDYGISDCTYSIHGREFKDLSFGRGETVEEIDDSDSIGHSLRIYPDGKKFIFAFKEIPTFDSGDRVWDSVRHVAIYCDDEGVNLIHCQHGYQISRIKIYIGLNKIAPEFSKWLNYIDCHDFDNLC